MVGVAKVETIDLKKNACWHCITFLSGDGTDSQKDQKPIQKLFFLQNYALEKGTLAEK